MTHEYFTYMSTQREVLEGQTGSNRAKRAKFGRGGPGVLPRKIQKTYIANGAIYVIPELYLWILLAYIVIKRTNYASFITIQANCNTKL